MVQVNSRAITEVTVLKGRAGCCLSRVEGKSSGDMEVVVRSGRQRVGGMGGGLYRSMKSEDGGGEGGVLR